MSYQNYKQSIEDCRERGFVSLSWREDVLDPITGNNTDRSQIEGESFVIDVVLTRPKVLEPENQKRFDDTRFTRIEISFEYATRFGTASYRHVNEVSPYERAKEYSIWQTTLIYEMLSTLERSTFPLN